MTKLIACSIYDSKTKTYTPPMYFKGQGEALRAFIDISDDEKNMISRHPEDYSLHHIGTFDADTAKLTGCTTYTCIAKAHEIKKDVTTDIAPENYENIMRALNQLIEKKS